MRGNEIANIASSLGWFKVRCRGSHHTFKHHDRPDHIVIPWANTGREVDAGLSKQILGQLRRGARRVNI